MIEVTQFCATARDSGRTGVRLGLAVASLGFLLGYEYARSASSSTFALRFDGLDLGVQGGADFVVAPHVAVGPFAAVSAGYYFDSSSTDPVWTGYSATYPTCGWCLAYAVLSTSDRRRDRPVPVPLDAPATSRTRAMLASFLGAVGACGACVTRASLRRCRAGFRGRRTEVVRISYLLADPSSRRARTDPLRRSRQSVRTRRARNAGKHGTCGNRVARLSRRNVLGRNVVLARVAAFHGRGTRAGHGRARVRGPCTVASGHARRQRRKQESANGSAHGFTLDGQVGPDGTCSVDSLRLPSKCLVDARGVGTCRPRPRTSRV